MFKNAIQNGISGIEQLSELERLKFSCQIAGQPKITAAFVSQYFTELELKNFNASGVVFAMDFV